MFKRSLCYIFIFPILVWLLVISFTITMFAQNRFSVGFTHNESIKTLMCDQNWHRKEMGIAYWPLVYDQLWMIGPAPEYKAIPRLAKEWETEDFKTWRFFLNEKAHFTDGRPVTTEDVVFSMLTLPKIDHSWYASDAVIKSYKIIDDYIVEFTLDRIHGGPYPPFYWRPILPKHIWQGYDPSQDGFTNEASVGSGPYLVKEFKPNLHLKLIRNDEYWGTAANFEEVVFNIFQNRSDLDSAMKNGLLDMMGYKGITPIQIPKYEQISGMKVVVSPGLELTWLSFNLFKKSPLQDLRVRQAIVYGLDKSKIISQAYRGYAKTIDSFVYPELPLYNSDLKEYAYDPEQASAMLKKAGYYDRNNDGIRNNPRTFKNLSFFLAVPSACKEKLKIATVIQECLKKIGINIDVMELDQEEYYKSLSKPAEGGFDIALAAYDPGPHLNKMWNLMGSPESGGKGHNTSFYINQAYDRILERMQTTVDQKKRRKYEHLMQEILIDDLPYVMLVRPYKITPIREDRIVDYVDTMGGLTNRINPWTYLEARKKTEFE